MATLTRLQMQQVEECFRVSAEDAAVVMSLPFGPPGGSSSLPPGWRYERQVAPGVHTWSSLPATGAFEPQGLWPEHAGKSTGSLRKFHARGVVLGAAPAHVAHLFSGTSAPGRLAWDRSYTGYETIVPAYTLSSSEAEAPPTPGARPAADSADAQHVTIAPILIVSARDFVSLGYTRRLDAAAPSARSSAHGTRTSASTSMTVPLLDLHPEPRYSLRPASDLVPGLVPGSILGTSCLFDPLPLPPALPSPSAQHDQAQDSSGSAYVADRESSEGVVRGEVLPGSKWLLQPLFAGEEEEEEGEAAPDVQEALLDAHSLPKGWTLHGEGEGEDTLLLCPYTRRRIIGTRILFSIYTDPKGWLPHAVVNQAVTDSFARYWTQMRAFLAAQGLQAVRVPPEKNYYYRPG